MRHSEEVLLAHLSEPDSLDVLAREGFAVEQIREVIPTDLIRRILAWALDRFFADGRVVAPSREAILATWADQLEALQIELPDPDIETDSIGFVIDDLRHNHARVMAEQWTTEFAREINTADGPERVKIFARYAEVMFSTAQQLVSRRNEAEGYEGVASAILRLHERIEDSRTTRGLTFGIPLLDEHMYGTHPGEITVVCSEAGVGKSWFAGIVLLNEWRNGRKAVLVTLENNTEMTFDRLVCMATGVPYDRFQRGDMRDDERAALFTLLDQMEHSTKTPVVVQLDPDQRTPSGIVRKAFLEDAESLIIDQLSFVRTELRSKTTGRNFQVNEIMHDLKELVDMGVRKIPVLLLVQINREGAKAARKEGRYRKEHLAESSGVEQTADFLWAIYQSDTMRGGGVVEFQSLKARRVPERHFELAWNPARGSIIGVKQIDLRARQEMV